ncbi:MAG: FG-GAP-like repeat-containing protein [Candidatus Electryonea clarkiae]|nr:FG-GAP-like repeat-containing protein [Candidatus Electryonea clarkiae]
MEIVDFNNNGNNDIITVSSYPYEKVSIFINTGGQPIEFEEIIVSQDIFWTIQHIDLDRDTDLDLICAGYDSGIKWFENTGSLVFVEHSIDRFLWRGDNGRSLNAIDFDCDGDIDFVDGVRDGISNNIGYIRWWENDGFQDFTIRIINDHIDSPMAINAIDIDEDGDIDIFTGARGGPFVWWENELDPVADASINGSITVEGTGEAVEGAEVIFGKFSDTSDENGHYEIDIAYSLPYTVLIRTEGFESYVEPDYDIEQGENRCDFEISPAETTPAQFSLISPDSNSYYTTEYNQLTWQSSTESDYEDSVVYDVYVQRSQIDSFYNPRITGLTDTFYTFQARGDSTWYWTVHARDTNSEGTWAGEVWSFVTFNVVSVEEEVFGIPQEYSIVSLHPNPFNLRVNIVIGIPEQTDLIAEVYDILGRQIAVLFSGNVQPGYQKISWQAEGSAGIYFLNISSSSGWTTTGKLLYLK